MTAIFSFETKATRKFNRLLRQAKSRRRVKKLIARRSYRDRIYSKRAHDYHAICWIWAEMKAEAKS